MNIKSVVIRNICDYFVTPTSQVIVELAKKQKLFVNHQDIKLKVLKQDLNPEHEAIRKKKNVLNRVKNYCAEELKDLMLAVTANRTMIHFGQRDVFRKHQK